METSGLIGVQLFASVVRSCELLNLLKSNLLKGRCFLFAANLFEMEIQKCVKNYVLFLIHLQISILDPSSGQVGLTWLPFRQISFISVSFFSRISFKDMKS